MNERNGNADNRRMHDCYHNCGCFNQNTQVVIDKETFMESMKAFLSAFAQASIDMNHDFIKHREKKAKTYFQCAKAVLKLVELAGDDFRGIIQEVVHNCVKEEI